ncbi:MAG: substrate-binding domain-containing protein [Succinivibrio sp.]|nr:substrate-binding domain-containing protein [Succinivibrio sp.]
MMMSKLISSALTLSSLCLSTALPAQALTVDFYLHDYSHIFTMETANSFQKLAQDAKVTVHFHDAKNDSKLQLEQLKKASGEVIVLDPVRPKDLQAQLSLAKQKQQKLIYLNYQPLQSELGSYANLWYVGSDYKQCAEALAQRLIDYTEVNAWYDLDGDGVFKILYLKGPKNDAVANALLSNFTSRLKAKGLEYQLINQCDSCTWNYNSAYSYISKLCKRPKFETFDAIVCANDDMALATIDAFEDHKPGFIGSFNLPVFSIDGLKQTYLYLRQGFLTATIDRRPSEIARLTLEVCQDQLKEPGNENYIKVDRQIFIPVKTLMFNNTASLDQEAASTTK